MTEFLYSAPASGTYDSTLMDEHAGIVFM